MGKMNENTRLEEQYTLLRDNYETLIYNVEEITDALYLIFDWLNCNPNPQDYTTFIDLITQHAKYYAVLNLVIDKLNTLQAENMEKFNASKLK